MTQHTVQSIDPVDSESVSSVAQLHRAGLSPRQRQALEEQVAAEHTELVRQLALRYSRRGIDTDDLIQVASLALVKAMRRYDPAQGDFLPYCRSTIAGELKKYFRDHGWSVRPPRRIQELQPEVSRLVANATSIGGRELIDRVASKLGTTREDVVEALSARGCFRPSSLEAPVREDGPTLGDSLTAADEGFELVEKRETLRPLWNELTEDERELLRMRFMDDMTQSEIASVLGISQMQVSRRLSKVIGHLREQVAPEAASAPSAA